MRYLITLLFLIFAHGAIAQSTNGHVLGGTEIIPLVPSSSAFSNIQVNDLANFIGTTPPSFSSGALNLTNGTSNIINWGQNGVGIPAFTNRSAGTKLVIYPNETGSTVDYAMGLAASTMWWTVPQANGTYFFVWYGGTTQAGYLTGGGLFNATSGFSAGGTTGVSCAANTVTLATLVVTGGIVTHC